MKVNFNYVGVALAVLGTCYSGYICYKVTNDDKNYRCLDDIKKEIKLKDPKRYDSLMHDGVYRGSYLNWQYEVNKMNDSIKTDSLMKRAYFEGAQMVRDSIKNAEKQK